MYYISVNWDIIKRLTAASHIPRIYTRTSLIFTLPAGKVTAPVPLHEQKYWLPDSWCAAPVRQDDMWQIKEKTPPMFDRDFTLPSFWWCMGAFFSCLSEQHCKIYSLNSFHQWCPHQYQTHILCHRHLLRDVEFKICDESTSIRRMSLFYTMENMVELRTEWQREVK